MAASHPGHNEIFTQQLKVDLSKPRYDMLTYQGRLRHYLDIVDPRTLLVGSAQLAKDKRLLADYAAGRAGARVTDADLWSAKKRVDAIIHPDTGEEIFMPFRMSGYVVRCYNDDDNESFSLFHSLRVPHVIFAIL